MAEPASQLIEALTEVRSVVAGARFPLRVPTATPATAVAGRLTRQLDDYVLPRLGRLDAPLLAVVGGSTGAGKSTLVNSLVRAPVSETGVLRPTTRAPLLVSHPDDTAWFGERRVLPGLTRSNASRTDRGSLQVISAPGLTAGLALLDAPDIDSVVDENRELAEQLLAAADLWLFVTTAARYADAVPWHVLRTARDRGTTVAIVLDRVPPGAEDEVAAHLREMLAGHNLGDVDVFVIPETALDGSGLLAESTAAPLYEYLAALAGDALARSDVIRTTLGGAIRSIIRDVDTLADAADEQTNAWSLLDDGVTRAYVDANDEIRTSLADGALLRGEVRTRWQEFIGTGDLIRAIRARVGRRRDRVVAMVTGRRSTGDDLRGALNSAVATLIEEHATAAREAAAQSWAATPSGAPLATTFASHSRDDLAERCEQLVRDWQRSVLDLAATEGTTKRRVRASSINATSLLVVIAVLASPTLTPTGAEIAIAGGTSATGQRLLEAAFGDESMQEMARTARRDLLVRVHEMLEVEAARFGDVRAAIDLDPTLPQRLRRSSDATDVAAQRSGLVASRADRQPDRTTARNALTKFPKTPTPPGASRVAWRPAAPSDAPSERSGTSVTGETTARGDTPATGTWRRR